MMQREQRFQFPAIANLECDYAAENAALHLYLGNLFQVQEVFRRRSYRENISIDKQNVINRAKKYE